MEKLSNRKNWPILNLLEPDFVPEIHMAMVYGKMGNKAIIVMKNKKVYSLDENFLGLDSCYDILYLREVKALCGKDVKTLVCDNDDHILALTYCGELYSSWNEDYYQLRQNLKKHNNGIPELVKVPIKINGSMSRVVDIACGSNHSVVITEEGKILTYGTNNKLMQVSYNEKLFNIPVLNRIYLNRKIVQVACGNNFSLALSETKEVYSWGCNFCGQLGTNNTSAEFKRYANRINSLPKIDKVVCGRNYALALSNEGKLYTWGGNEHGQLGIKYIKRTCFTCVPHMITHRGMGRVFDIAALHSSYISVAVGENGYVYMWGQCCGQDILVPTLAQFSTIHDVLGFYALPRFMHKPLNLHKDEGSSMLECLQNAFNDKSTSDLIIEVENRPIYVHKALLKIRSTYFRNMFQHNWLENNQNIIKQTEFSYTVFKAFIKYLYTNVVDLSPEKTGELLKLADLYCEDNLKRYCVRLIKDTISISNVLFLYSSAIEYNVKELEESCFNFITKHMLKLVHTKDFDNLNQNTLVTFIRQAAKAGVFTK